jgi:hypothetical protein
MYQFSRSIYRALYGEVIGDGCASVAENRQRVLEACEEAMQRLASDRHYFARPSRTLFKDVRVFFPMRSQMRVYGVIDHYMRLATAYVDQHARAGLSLDGSPLCCHATTRKGTACQRLPLPGAKYCPSHQHLEERFETTAAA